MIIQLNWCLTRKSSNSVHFPWWVVSPRVRLTTTHPANCYPATWELETGSSREFCHNIIWQLNNWSRDNNLELFKPDLSSECFITNWTIPLNEGVQYGKSCNISALFWLLGTIDCSHISQSVLFYSQLNILSKQSGKCTDQILFSFIESSNASASQLL